MKIRKRITITFISLFGLLIVILCAFVYFTAANSQETIFFNRLENRVKVTEAFFLEGDVLSPKIKQKVKNQFLQTLPGEIEFVEKRDIFMAKSPKKVKKELPKNFISTLKNETSLSWTSGDKQGVARVYQKNGAAYIVTVIAKDIYGHEYLRKLLLILCIASAVTLASAYFLSVYFSRQVLRPIAEKIEKANRISASELDLRLTVYNENDELGMLAKSFNGLLDRLQESIELEKNFVRYASHELKNPLAVILGESEVALLSSRTENEYIETIEKIKEKAEKLNDLVEHFLQLSRMEASQLKRSQINIDELIVEIIFECSQSKSDAIELRFHLDDSLETEDLEIHADKLLISKAIFNLVENALKYSSEPGHVEVAVKNALKKDSIEIVISDKGQGIAEDDIKHIYKPLYRGSNSERIAGTGIGLALVKKIIDLHHGSIQVFSVEGQGTTFTISLPKT
jgi:signal transduction histidine kinase